MKIVSCPACGKWSHLLEDETALRGVDCPLCGYSQTWQIEDDIDIDTRKIDLSPSITDENEQDFLDFLNSLML